MVSGSFASEFQRVKLSGKLARSVSLARIAVSQQTVRFIKDEKA